jgi:Tetratricopeptide repeat
MELLSLLDPNGIPSAIIDTPEIHAYLGAASAAEIRTALEALGQFNLIEFADDDSDLVTVHMLVQRAVRETAVASRDEATRVLADSMAAQWPAQQHGADQARRLRGNALALYTANPGPLQAPGLHPLLFLLGNSYGQAGLLDQAHDYFAALLGQAAATLGPDTRDTLHARQREAYWLGFRGRAGQALGEFEALAADQARVLGPDDRDTLISRHNVARFRGRSGDPQGAVADLRILIADETRALGATDLETLKSRNILGYWLNMAGDPRDAVTELTDVLPLNVEHLGPDHDETLRARNDLAMAMAAAGEYASAIAEGELVVRDRIRVLGAEDPATLSSRAYLAHWRTLAGQDSLADLRAIVSDHERVLGARQPNTLRARTYYIEALAASGDIAGAVAEMEHHLEVTREVLGDHILTARCEDKLREWRGGA